MKKNKFIFLIIIVLASIILLTGCNKKIDQQVNNDKLEIENKLQTIQADAVITSNFFGGECIEYIEYHISYNNAKVYEYKKFTYVPLTDKKELSTTNTYTLKEYDINKNQIEKLKQFIEKEEKIKKTEGRAEDYMLKIGNQVYYIDNAEEIYEILKEIRS